MDYKDIGKEEFLNKAAEKRQTVFQKSVGSAKKVMNKPITLKVGIVVGLVVVMLFIGLAAGRIHLINAQQRYIGSEKEYKDQMKDVNAFEIDRIKQIFKDNGLKVEPDKKAKRKKSAEYNNDYSVLIPLVKKGEFTDDDVYGTYMLFNEQGSLTAQEETEKILQVLGYGYKVNGDGSLWPAFLENRTELIKNKYGQMQKITSYYAIDSKTSSIEVWLKAAEYSVKSRYDILKVISDRGYTIDQDQLKKIIEGDLSSLNDQPEEEIDKGFSK